MNILGAPKYTVNSACATDTGASPARWRGRTTCTRVGSWHGALGARRHGRDRVVTTLRHAVANNGWEAAHHQLPPPTRQCSHFPPARGGGDGSPSIRFAPSPVHTAPASVLEHRPWRSATPILPRRATASPADLWTWSPAGAWPSPSSSPHALIQGSSSGLPLNSAAGTPIQLAPSSHDTMMVVFGHSFFRGRLPCSRAPLTWAGTSFVLSAMRRRIFVSFLSTGTWWRSW
jgi:hypothetical protein